MFRSLMFHSPRFHSPVFRFMVLLLLAVPATVTLAQDVKCPPPTSIMKMDKGEYSNLPGVVFELQSFSARLEPRGKRAPLCYVKIALIDRGDVFVSSDSLTHLFGQKLAQSHSQIKDVQVEMKENEIHLSGKMKKVLWLPFSVSGPVTTDGKNLRIQAKEIKALGIEVKGLMDALGKHLQTLVGSESPKGVIVEGDNLTFQPSEIAHVTGHISSVAVTTKGLSVQFGDVTVKKSTP